MKIFTYERYDYCNICNTDKGIECYDKYDKTINYSYFITAYMRGNIISTFDNKELTYMKCKRCGYVYAIDWTNGVPLPLRNFRHIENFLYNNYGKRLQ